MTDFVKNLIYSNAGAKAKQHEKRVDDLASSDKLVRAYNDTINTGDAQYIKHGTKDLSQYEEIYIAPFADWHIGDQNCNIQTIIIYLMIAKYIPTCYIILNGDLINNANNLGKSSSLENALSPGNEMRILNKLLSDKGIREKILVVNTGNHENGPRMKDVGIDVMANQLAGTDLFDVYSRYTSRLNIKLKSNSSSSGIANISIFADHGNSLSGEAGKILNTIVNQLEPNFGYSDIICVGNSHKEIFAKHDKVFSDVTRSGMQTKSTTFIYSNPPQVSSASYSQDWRLPPVSTDMKFLRVSTKPNLDLLDATPSEKMLLKDYSVTVEAVDMLDPRILDFVCSESAKYSKKINFKIPDLVTNIKSLYTKFSKEAIDDLKGEK